MLRGYLKNAGVAAVPILDWQHLSRRVQIAKTTAQGLRCLTNAERRAQPLIAKALESLHWKLWHANINGARQAMSRIFKLLEPSRPNSCAPRWASSGITSRAKARIWWITAYANATGSQSGHQRPKGWRTLWSINA
jgi:hypothetical protein